MGAVLFWVGLKPVPANAVDLRWTRFSFGSFVVGLSILVLTGLVVAFVGILALVEGDPGANLPALMLATLPTIVGGALTIVALNSRRRD